MMTNNKNPETYFMGYMSNVDCSTSERLRCAKEFIDKGDFDGARGVFNAEEMTKEMNKSLEEQKKIEESLKLAEKKYCQSLIEREENSLKRLDCAKELFYKGNFKKARNIFDIKNKNELSKLEREILDQFDAILKIV